MKKNFVMTQSRLSRFMAISFFMILIPFLILFIWAPFGVHILISCLGKWFSIPGAIFGISTQSPSFRCILACYLGCCGCTSVVTACSYSDVVSESDTDFNMSSFSVWSTDSHSFAYGCSVSLQQRSKSRRWSLKSFASLRWLNQGRISADQW